MRRALLTTLSLLAFIHPACAATPLPVVASFSILGDMVKQVGGDDVIVKTLVGPNSDTHTYEPTPNDARTIAQAQIVFINGLGFEGWMSRLISASGFKGTTVTASTGITPRTMPDENNPKVTEIDPHAWQNLGNGIVYIRNIAKALEAVLPEKKDAIEQRASAYEAELKAEDSAIRDTLASVPQAKRRIITSHDAFGYFGEAYNVEFLAPVGMNTEAEPSPAGLAKMIQQMKHEGIKTVFLENMASPRLATQLAKEGGAELGSELYSDALSAPDGKAPTYLDMFKSNVPALKAAMMESTAK